MEKTKKTNPFSVTDSMCLKGVAIILLMCIHCFGSKGRFEGYEFNFWPLSEELYIQLAYYCKICVSIFAFISGYGLYLSARKKTNDLTETNKWIVSRLIKTLSSFWLWYVISFVATSLYNNLPEKYYFTDGIVRGVVYMLLDFFGIATLFGTPILNGSWWYMSAAVVYIVLLPLLVKWTDKLGWASLFASIIIIPRILFNNEFFGASNIFSFFLPVYFGALFAHFDLFGKIEEFKIVKNKIFNEILLFVGGLFAVFVSIYLWIRVPYKVLWEYHFAVAPLFVIVFCNRFIFREGGFIRKAINTVFAFLGKHSMNIFVFHTFLRAYFLKKFLFSMKYPILTILSLLLISLLLSIVFELLKKLIRYDKLISLLEKKILSFFPA